MKEEKSNKEKNETLPVKKKNKISQANILVRTPNHFQSTVKISSLYNIAAEHQY